MKSLLFKLVFHFSCFVVLSGCGKIAVAPENAAPVTPHGTHFQAMPSGTLDISFGTNGALTFQYQNKYFEAQALTIQVDSKIVVVGRHGSSTMIVVRFNPDGKLDSSFGVDGGLSVEFGATASLVSRAVRVSPETGIISVAAQRSQSTATSSNIDFIWVQFNSNGSLNTTFGSGGMKSLNKGGTSLIKAVFESDGSVLFLGYSVYTTTGNGYQLLSRVLANGSYDTSFGVSGVKSIFSLASTQNWFGDFTIQKDRKIVLCGGDTVQKGSRVRIERLTINGSLDGTGSVEMPIALGDKLAQCGGVVVQEDGKIIAGGGTQSCQPGTFNCEGKSAIIRFNADLTPDTSFNGSGISPALLSNSTLVRVALDANGKIVTQFLNNSSNLRTGRLNSDGSLDMGFNQGTWYTDMAMPTNEHRYSDFAIQSDGKILIWADLLLNTGTIFRGNLLMQRLWP